MSQIQEIPKRLKVARIAAGYPSAKSFTTAYNIPSSTYSNHENGNRTLTIENIFYYSKLLNLNPAWLITGKDSPCGDVYNEQLEKKILEEQEILFKKNELSSTVIAVILETNKHSTIDTKLFKNVLIELVRLLKQIPNAQSNEAVSFCFEVYNRIVATNAEGNDRIDLIKLCFESFIKGLGIRNMEDFLKNNAMAG